MNMGVEIAIVENFSEVFQKGKMAPLPSGFTFKSVSYIALKDVCRLDSSQHGLL